MDHQLRRNFWGTLTILLFFIDLFPFSALLHGNQTMSCLLVVLGLTLAVVFCAAHFAIHAFCVVSSKRIANLMAEVKNLGSRD